MLCIKNLLIFKSYKKNVYNHFKKNCGNYDSLPMPSKLQKPLEWYLKDPLNTVIDVNLGPTTTAELQTDMKKLKNKKYLGLASTCGIY